MPAQNATPTEAAGSARRRLSDAERKSISDLTGAGVPSAMERGQLPNSAPSMEAGNLVYSPPYQYGDTSPVRELNAGEIISAARIFQESIREYKTDKDGRKTKSPKRPYRFLLKKGLFDLKERFSSWTRARDWNSRGNDAQLIAEDIETHHGSTTFSYDLNGRPVAMMALDHRGGGTTIIDHLATHPAVANAGELMIEKAVNESESNGNHGKLKLISLNRKSDSFYYHMGFEKLGKGQMFLDPRSDDYWILEDGVWRVDKNEKRQYLMEAEDTEL
jgi:hypothetical protein